MVKNLNKKSGFSLVEVMILFTVLAIFISASMPLITRKSKPIPKLPAHGVYLCINNGDGTYTEQTYSAFSMNSSNVVESCRFDVPRADEYKVELYSAGAGGIKYAEYESQEGDNRTLNFDANTAVEYTNNRNMQQIMDNAGLTFTPTNEQFTNAMSGVTGTLTSFTGEGSKGGTAEVEYQLIPNACEDSEEGWSRDSLLEQNKPFFPGYSFNFPYENGAYIYTSYDPDTGKASLLRQELHDWCMYAKYEQGRQPKADDYGYNQSAYKPQSLTKLEVQDLISTVRQEGGEGGHGLYLRLIYPFSPTLGNSKIYTQYDAQYPFLHYWADFFGLLTRNYMKRKTAKKLMSGRFSGFCDFCVKNHSL